MSKPWYDDYSTQDPKSAAINTRLLDELRNLADAAERSLYYPDDYRPFHEAITKAKAVIAEADQLSGSDEREI